MTHLPKMSDHCLVGFRLLKAIRHGNKQEAALKQLDWAAKTQTF
jgi:hypothetical protein